jgi:hypothetical protein
MTWTMTDTDSDATRETEWQLVPQQFPVSAVAPPTDNTNLHGVTYDYSGLVFRARLIGESQVQTVSNEIFDRLTEESLLEHGDLWRNLASR